MAELESSFQRYFDIDPETNSFVDKGFAPIVSLDQIEKPLPTEMHPEVNSLIGLLQTPLADSDLEIQSQRIPRWSWRNAAIGMLIGSMTGLAVTALENRQMDNNIWLHFVYGNQDAQYWYSMWRDNYIENAKVMQKVGMVIVPTILLFMGGMWQGMVNDLGNPHLKLWSKIQPRLPNKVLS